MSTFEVQGASELSFAYSNAIWFLQNISQTDEKYIRKYLFESVWN